MINCERSAKHSDWMDTNQFYYREQAHNSDQVCSIWILIGKLAFLKMYLSFIFLLLLQLIYSVHYNFSILGYYRKNPVSSIYDILWTRKQNSLRKIQILGVRRAYLFTLQYVTEPMTWNYLPSCGIIRQPAQTSTYNLKIKMASISNSVSGAPSVKFHEKTCQMKGIK